MFIYLKILQLIVLFHFLELLQTSFISNFFLIANSSTFIGNVEVYQTFIVIKYSVFFISSGKWLYEWVNSIRWIGILLVYCKEFVPFSSIVTKVIKLEYSFFRTRLIKL